MNHRITLPEKIVDELLEEMRYCEWLRNDTAAHVVSYFPGGYSWTMFPAAMLPWNRNNRPKNKKLTFPKFDIV